jgi:hypothetical protein
MLNSFEIKKTFMIQFDLFLPNKSRFVKNVLHYEILKNNIPTTNGWVTLRPEKHLDPGST